MQRENRSNLESPESKILLPRDCPPRTVYTVFLEKVVYRCIDFPLPGLDCPVQCTPPQRDPDCSGILGLFHAWNEEHSVRLPHDRIRAPPSSRPPGLTVLRPHRVTNSPAGPPLQPSPPCGNSRLPRGPKLVTAASLPPGGAANQRRVTGRTGRPGATGDKRLLFRGSFPERGA